MKNLWIYANKNVIKASAAFWIDLQPTPMAKALKKGFMYIFFSLPIKNVVALIVCELDNY